MGSRTNNNARFADLSREIHSIHLDNRLFWSRNNCHNHQSAVDYYRRLARLEEIRQELSLLRH
jgi:hypothetical protein